MVGWSKSLEEDLDRAKLLSRIKELEARVREYGGKALSCEENIEINMCTTDDNVLPLVDVCQLVRENPYKPGVWMSDLVSALRPFR